MQPKLFPSFDEAIGDLADGSSIMIGGFSQIGIPYNLLRALHNRGSRGLTVIANSTPFITQPDLITLAQVVGARQVRKAVLAFTASTHPSRRTTLEDLNEAGEVEAELVAQGTLAERIRSGGAGIPAFYTPAAVGTELAEGKEHRVFNGRTYILEEAITADYAFVRAWKADEFGNLVFKGSQRNFNPIMAMAARCTIAEVEEVVPIGSIDPDDVHTSGVFVHRIVKIPPDGVFHVSRVGG